MRTRDLDEAVAAVTEVYCEHRVRVTDAACSVDVRLEVARPTTQPMVELSYGAPVHIDAGAFPRLFLIMHCAGGAARARQAGREARWQEGGTLPFSAGLETELWFDRAFVQRGVRLGAEQLETLCARWLGYPLTQPLRFSLHAFSPQLEQVWQRTLAYLWAFESNGRSLVGAAKASFDEYLLTLLLHQHPHNYSDDLQAPPAPPVPRLVRRAERYMIDHADAAITVSDVAAELGVSVRTLQEGFRRCRSTTPIAVLRQARLQRVRDELLRRDCTIGVTAVALRFGFAHLGRFSASYRAAFGESPSVTWRRVHGARAPAPPAPGRSEADAVGSRHAPTEGGAGAAQLSA